MFYSILAVLFLIKLIKKSIYYAPKSLSRFTVFWIFIVSLVLS